MIYIRELAGELQRSLRITCIGQARLVTIGYTVEGVLPNVGDFLNQDSMTR